MRSGWMPTKSGPGIRLRAIVLGGLAVLLAVAAGAELDRAGASAVHGEVVQETPRITNRAVPIVDDGLVRAHAQIGSMIVVGGDFTTVVDIDGSSYTVSNLFAYDIYSGRMNLGFTPALDGLVRALEVSPDGSSLYVGGLFTSVNGSAIEGVARFDSSLSLDTNFDPAIDGPVYTLAVSDDRVYAGGSFGFVNGLARKSLVALMPSTGDVDPAFTFDVEGSVDLYSGGQPVQGASVHGVWAVILTPDNQSLFSAHTADTVAGQPRPGIAKIDVSDLNQPSLTGWAANPYFTENCFNLAGTSGWEYQVRDAAMSPDGTYFVVGASGGDRTPLCDTVQRYEVAGDAPVDPTWIARMYSSVFSVAVSDAAVYVSGHFCAAPKVGVDPEVGGVTSTTYDRRLNGCVNDPDAPIEQRAPYLADPDLAVARDDLAALDPVTAAALEWNPGTNNETAGYDVTTVDTGLLYGGDSDEVNFIEVGRSAFFELPPPDEANPPTTTIESPAPGLHPTGTFDITGTATDDSGIASVRVWVRDVDDLTYLQPDGSFAAAQHKFDATLVPAVGGVTFTVPGITVPVGQYLITASAADIASTPNFDTNSIAVDVAAPDLNPEDGSIERVVHISIDGLQSAVVNTTHTPTLAQLAADGTATLNARTDFDSTKTMPNHTSQLTGRHMLGAGGHGVTVNQWPDVNLGAFTVHDVANEYVHSVFDVVHDHGLQTAAYVSKSKLEYIHATWSLAGGADTTGADDGTAKIDTWLRDNPTNVTNALIDQLSTADPADYSFLHLRNPDDAGHLHGWGSQEYLDAVGAADALVDSLLYTIATDSDLAATTALIVTADHGGVDGFDGHGDPTEPSNYTIPFIYWGPTIATGLDMYEAYVGVRTDPGTARVPNAAGASSDPVRGHDAANLALGLLGLPPVPGSQYDLGARRCDGRTVTVDLGLGQVPTPGPDVILGTSGPDVIAAGDGDDVVCAGAGDDNVIGGAGDDVIFGESGDDLISGNAGADSITGGAGVDTVYGGGGDDVITGDGGDDAFLGGGSGSDRIDGGSGDDRINGGSDGDQRVDGGDGADTVLGGGGNDPLIFGGPGDDSVGGNGGKDTLFGEDGNDTMFGGPNDDNLYGGPGDDFLGGNQGVDLCDGGDDVDTAAGNCETVVAVP